jgi:hypothetical protein
LEEIVMSALKKIFMAAKKVLTLVRELFRQWRVMAALTIVYASLLATLFLFVATKEATLRQIILTLVSAALVPALFFILQAMMVGYAHGEGRAYVLLKRSLEDSCKLALASVPVALVGLLLFYLLNKLQTYYPAHAPVLRPAQNPFTNGTRAASSMPPLQWTFAALSTMRLIIFGIVLPLITIRLWSATLLEGLVKALKGIHRHAIRALQPKALRVYVVGLMLFGLVPYLLLFMRTPASSLSTAYGLFIARLALVFVFILFGWAWTLCSLAGGAKVEDASARQIEREPSLCEAEL